MTCSRRTSSFTRLRCHRGEAALVVIYVLGAVVAGVTGYKLLKWNPFKEQRVTAAAKKFEDAEARYHAASEALEKAQANAQQQTVAINDDVKRQTQAAQSMVAATGQALAAAPPELLSDMHISAARQTNAVAAHALESAIGPLSADQLTEVNRLVANATAASEAQRARADAELATVKQQLAAEQADKQKHQTLLQSAQTQLEAARKTADAAQTVVQKTTQQLNAVSSERDGLRGLLDDLFLWLKIAAGLYCVVAYGLPLASRFLPGLRPLSDIAHALINPFMHVEKAGNDKLARDASAATDVLLEFISHRVPDALEEAKQLAGDWITEHDGIRSRYEQMLKLVFRR